MSGWRQPTPPAPDGPPTRSRWTAPGETDALSPGQLIRNGWRLYRSSPRRFLLVAILPELARDLLAIPGLLVAGRAIQGAFDVLAGFLDRVAANPEAYRSADSFALRADLQAQLQADLQALVLPQADLAVWFALAGGIGLIVALIGSAALTAMALGTGTRRPISVVGAFRLVAARGGLLKPIATLGIASLAFSALSFVLEHSTDVQAWAGAPGSPRTVLLGSLLGVLALVVGVAIVVLAVRWALYIPAVLAEGLGVGRGLARAARLTRGIRIRLGLAMLGLAILNALVVGIAATVIGFVVGLSAGSVPAGFAAYVVASLLGNLLWAPLPPAMLALAYVRVAGATDPVEESTTVP